ncbi:MAG TPA: PHP domain-containing protein [Thermoanaerobaculia bacterium]|nr:PHP domain-containing protein [Thermoanaerobaculia bacterium]
MIVDRPVFRRSTMNDQRSTTRLMSGLADLHLHTYHSDGIRSPAEVVRLAGEHGLSVIAISDHDTLRALPEAEPLARAAGILLIPAVELSITWEGVDVHLLAYAFDPEDAALADTLTRCRATRELRGETMAERLRSIGVAIDMDRLREICGGGSVGRPHVARCLVEIGAVASIDEAFERYLSPGCPGWVEKERIELDEAIALVHDAGGLTSIAHPTCYPDAERLVRAMVPHGVDAIEVLHPDVPSDAAARFRAIASEHGIFTTGGSDDHGFEGRKTIGSVPVPVAMIQPIVDRWQSRRGR